MIAAAAAIGWLATADASTLEAWGTQGHHLVAQIAASRLTRIARENVAWLIGPETLTDVSLWADQFRDDNYQTSFWHFLNIPPGAARYDRDRDCPRQPTVAAGAFADKWRDCAVDRILYNNGRLADARLDRADRAIALKFVVHLVGDIHQPFHAVGVERGGNGVPVGMFGSENCAPASSTVFSPCNLHGAWDSGLIAHRGLDERQYVALLEESIRRNGWNTRAIGTPPDWAEQSFRLGMAALVAPHANIDEAYFRAQLPNIDERLALAGLRLAALINQSLATAIQ